jgi:hypothetical protein
LIISHKVDEKYDEDLDGRNETTFNIMYFVERNSTIDEMEQFFDKMWTQMGCRHYELWSEC